MESLPGIVDAVIKRGAKAPRALVAFVTRMLAYRSGQTEAMSASVVDTILQYVSSDHPSPLTVRMQAVFDSAYYSAHVAVDQRRRARRKRLDELADEVCSASADSFHDVSALSAVYKKMFAYTLIVASLDASTSGRGTGTRTSSAQSGTRSVSAVPASRSGSRVLTPKADTLGSSSISGLMPAHADAVQKEVAAAMESVFPKVRQLFRVLC